MPEGTESAALITALILERPMCPQCIAAKTDMSVIKVMAYLEQIAESIVVQRAPGEPCPVCGVVGPVVSIVRD